SGSNVDDGAQACRCPHKSHAKAPARLRRCSQPLPELLHDEEPGEDENAAAYAAAGAQHANCSSLNPEPSTIHIRLRIARIHSGTAPIPRDTRKRTCIQIPDTGPSTHLRMDPNPFRPKLDATCCHIPARKNNSRTPSGLTCRKQRHCCWR